MDQHLLLLLLLLLFPGVGCRAGLPCTVELSCLLVAFVVVAAAAVVVVMMVLVAVVLVDTFAVDVTGIVL